MAEFANAPEEVQLAALTYLRGQSTYQAIEHFGTILATFLSAVALYAVAVGSQFGRILDELAPGSGSSSLPPVVRLSLFAAVFLLIQIITTFGLLWVLHRGRLPQAIATLWLLAYEAELARRATATGRKAKRWRKAHPILWG
ncbi:hypothetical protein BH09ACT5_BH09ACT5_01180 [soil metagenome]